MRPFKRRALTVAGAALALLLAGTSIAVAAATSSSGTSVTRTRVYTEDAASVHTGSAFATLRSTTLYAGSGSIILATFSAESACYGGSGWCSVRILIDGIEAAPVSGTDFAFDSTDSGAEGFGSWESHSMQRSRTVTFTGTHTIAVQVAHVGSGVTARYDDWTLSLLAIAP